MNYALLTARRRALPPRPVPTITITQQPSSQDAASGVASFSVAATTNFDGLLSYQWQVSVDAGSTWATVSGATGYTISLSGLTTASDNGKLYRVLVSAEGAETATSNSALLTVGAWDVSTLAFVSGQRINTYLQQQGEQNEKLADPTAVVFSLDGTRVYIPCTGVGKLLELNLTSPWDLQTAADYRQTWISAFNFDAAGISGIAIRPDGMAMFLLNASTQAITEHALSTPWSTLGSSASYAPTRTFSVSGLLRGLAFRPDGQRMYISGGGSIGEYHLPTAWNIETAALVRSYDVSSFSLSLSDVFFRDDGRRMYATSFVNTDGVAEFSLATPWDVSTSAYIRVQSLLGANGFIREDSPQGIAIKPDGRRLFVVGIGVPFPETQNQINEYTLG
jgi:sugar lactone lactonase YvrE